MFGEYYLTTIKKAQVLYIYIQDWLHNLQGLAQCEIDGPLATLTCMRKTPETTEEP